MDIKARIIIILLSISLFLFVLNLIRKRKMRIEYSILWFLIGLIILLVSIWQNMADQISFLIGIEYPPALFFLIAIFFVILMKLHFSIEMTKLKDQNKTLVQEISILKHFINTKD